MGRDVGFLHKIEIRDRREAQNTTAVATQVSQEVGENAGAWGGTLGFCAKSEDPKNKGCDHKDASGNKAHQEVSSASVCDGLRFLGQQNGGTSLGRLLFVRNHLRQVQTTEAMATHTLRQHRRGDLCDGCRLRFSVRQRLRDFSQDQRITRSAVAANSNPRNVISKNLAIASQKAGHFCEPKVTRKTAS